MTITCRQYLPSHWALHRLAGHGQATSERTSTAKSQPPTGGLIAVDLPPFQVYEWPPGREGVVLMLSSGKMYKVKSRWYLALHTNAGVNQLPALLTDRPTVKGVCMVQECRVLVHLCLTSVRALARNCVCWPHTLPSLTRSQRS